MFVGEEWTGMHMLTSRMYEGIHYRSVSVEYREKLKL